MLIEHMIHFLFVVNKSRNISSVGRLRRELVADVSARLGLRPLTARSIVLSVLLGSHPPSLPGAAIVGLVEQFGIRPGTARTAISRLVAAGELDAVDGRYQLSGRLVDRQRQQDTGRVPPDPTWNGEWTTVVTHAGARPMAARRAFRSTLVGARFGELRPDVWLRPANIETVAVRDLVVAGDVLAITGPIDVAEPGHLVAQLWPLVELQSRADDLLSAMADHRFDDDVSLAVGFTISAAVVRFLRSEPQLPVELAPDVWSPPAVRSAYDTFESAFQRHLQAFFRARLAATSP